MTPETPSIPNQAPSTAGMTTKVVKGSIWTLAGQVLPLGVALFTAPFVIRFLGAEGYGVLVLVGLIPRYLGFADFGMSVASTKFASEAYGAGDRPGEANIVRTAAIIALITVSPFVIGLFAFSNEIARLVNVPNQYHGEASSALKIMSVSLVFSTLSFVLNTPLLARLRMDLNTLTYTVPLALSLAATPFVLFFGGGIVGAVWGVLLGNILVVAGQLYFARRLLPELFHPTIDKNLLRPLLNFGAGMMAAVIAVVILQNLEKILLPTMVSVKALAYYSVAFTFANMTSMFASSMVQSLIPAFSQLLTPDKKGEFDALFSRGIRLNMIWIPPAIMFLFVIARPFFSLWAGEDFGRESTLPFYVLLVGLLCNLGAYVPYSAIIAYGRSDVFAKLHLVELMVFAVLTFALVNSFGIVGAAAAWSLRVTIDGIVLMWLTKQIVGVSFKFVLHLSYLVLGVLLLSPPMLFAAFYDNFSLWLGPMVALFTLLYALLVWNFLVDRDEKLWIVARIRSLRMRTRMV